MSELYGGARVAFIFNEVDEKRQRNEVDEKRARTGVELWMGRSCEWGGLQ